MVKILADRLKDTGDVSYLRRKNDDLTSQLRESRREESRVKGFLKEADAKIEKMSAELIEMRRRIGSSSADPEKFPPLPSKSKQGTLARATTPKQERKAKRGSSVSETLIGCNEQLEAISRFDDKIMQFEEIIRKMRADLYGSVESVAERVSKTASVVDPPRRGLKIISDIQLVPPRLLPEPATGSQDEREPLSDFDSWTEVTKKRNRKQVRIAAGPAGPAGVAVGADRVAGRPQFPSVNSNVGRRRAPRNAAVAIKANEGGPSYADIMKIAKEKINLKELGIVNLRTRIAANGGRIIEIPGPESTIKADTLVSRLREIVVVSRRERCGLPSGGESRFTNQRFRRIRH